MANLNVNYDFLLTTVEPTSRNVDKINDIMTLNAQTMAVSTKCAENLAHDGDNSINVEASALLAATEHITTPVTRAETTPTTASTTTKPAVQATQRPTTPIPTKKFANKRAPNLSLHISKTKPVKYAETENAMLSSATYEQRSGGNMAAVDAAIARTTLLTSANSSASTSACASPSAPGSTFPHEHEKTIKKLNIAFENICFVTKTGFFKRENKQILNGLTGEFRAGELSAIVGPSGAGKSTFLNILSSYTPFGYSGKIRINGNIRDVKTFKPNVAFITQDTTLQPFLSVNEAMHFAANLKIGAHMTKHEKHERVRKILEAIGMYETRHTRTGELSGGQRKRLAIALELVDNPPVLILDEPTSGLDSSTSNQCILLLKKLAMEGRTIICTIHQPSALSFEMFDHLYSIAEGQCIYAGGTENLVPFLSENDLQCPQSYNPADFLMEIATNDYGPNNQKLIEKMQNGRNEQYRQTSTARKIQLEAMRKVDKLMEEGLMTPVYTPHLFNPINDCKKSGPSYQYYNIKPLTPINELSSRVWDSSGVLSEHEQHTKEHQQQQQQQQQQSQHQRQCSDNSFSKPKKPKIQIDTGNLCKRDNIYATPFYRQLGILLVRTFLILWRDSSLTTMRFVIHFVTALLIGFLYYDIGNDAANALNNFRYAFYSIMFIMYCAFSSILVKFPLEFPIVSREHFNRWYSLRSYYVAITLADIPIQIICTSLFVFPTYILTGQPMELLRITLFSLIVFLTALVGQSIGLAVGASLSVKLGAIFGPFFICPFLAFSGFFLQHKDCPYYLKFMFRVSFLKYSFDGAMLALFGYERPKLECSSMYCHYSRPTIFLKDMDMSSADYETGAMFLFLLFIGLRIVAFYIMSFRLRLFR